MQDACCEESKSEEVLSQVGVAIARRKLGKFPRQPHILPVGPRCMLVMEKLSLEFI